MKTSVTIAVNAETVEKIKEFYSSEQISNDGEYVYFQAGHEGVIVTIYSSKKDLQKVTFLGDEALKEAQIWDENAKINEPKVVEKEKWLFFGNQIGSDEVGVGDFLLPMIVVAAYVNKKDISRLIKLGIHDSKKMNDDFIRSIGEELTKSFHYSKLTITNEKYNEMIAKGENLNSLKAKMHNRALYNLHEDYPDVTNIFVDQFVNEKTYYSYLVNGQDNALKGITFKTKGESFFPCVALASVIARYAFLLEKDKLEAKYGMSFPCGAGHKVTDFAKLFLEKHGIDEFNKIAKKNFANYREVISEPLL